MAAHIMTSNEDYIDIILTSYSPSDILCCPSSPRSRLSSNNIDFKFRNPLVPIEEEPSLIPADDDDLFHNGKFLPLYFSQTGQETPMKPVVEDNKDLYCSSTFLTFSKDQTFDDDIQPCSEDNGDENFFEWSIDELNGFVSKMGVSKNSKSWMDKVKLFLGCWMRAETRVYLTSLFLCCRVKKRAFSVATNKVTKEGIKGSTRSMSSVTRQWSSTTSSCSIDASSSSSCSFDAKVSGFRRSSDDDEDAVQEDMESSVDAY